MNEMTKGDLIESRISKEVTSTTATAFEFGGLRVQNMLEVMEVSKLMAVSQQAVPAHLRNNPGMCLAVCLTALEWKMSPFAVANKSYVTNDRLNYESQLVHAVIEARAPLKERLKVRYEGEGDDLVCIVSGTFRGETEPRELRSAKLSDARPPVNEYGKIKGSPLWTKKPSVQLFYDTSRDWIRMYAPDVLLGIYTPDEIEQYGEVETPKDITPDPAKSLHERLAQASRSNEGFRDGVVHEGLAENAAGEPAATAPSTDTAPTPETAQAGRRRRRVAGPTRHVGDDPAVTGHSSAPAVTPVAAGADTPPPPGGSPAPSDSPQPGSPLAGGSDGGSEQTEAAGDGKEVVRDAVEGRTQTVAAPQPETPAAADPVDAYIKKWDTALPLLSYDNAAAQWDGEREERDKLGIPIRDRARIEHLINAKNEDA